MKFQSVSIDLIEIERFKKIKNLKFSPRAGGNLFFGAYRSGKTSLCEFIQFVLYGADSVVMARGNAEDAKGSIVLSADGTSFTATRSVIGGAEEISFVYTESRKAVETELTPGEYLMDLNREDFDLLSYFKQSRYETPFSRPKASFLEDIAARSSSTRQIYSERKHWQAKSDEFRNSKKNGRLDLLDSERTALAEAIRARPEYEQEVESCARSLEEVSKKMDENDRRCVLLKADMATHTDDLKLSQNKKNAEELNRQIQANEKKLRMMSYGVSQKVGKLTPEELEAMKGDYNRLSIAVTNLRDARMALTEAEENLSFHQQFLDEDYPSEYYESERRSIQISKIWRMILRILSVLTLTLGAEAALILHHLKATPTLYFSVGIGIGICGLILLSCSRHFSRKIREILERNGKDNAHQFREDIDRLKAYETTAQLYREQVESAAELCERREAEKDSAQEIISHKIQVLGYREEDGEVLAICDEIIEANEILYDLELSIQEEKEEYRKLLSTDISTERITVSREFLNLQKELDFLTVQNDTLYKKRCALEDRLETAKRALAYDPKAAAKKLKKLQAETEKETVQYETVSVQLALASSRVDRFEADLRNRLAEQINAMLAFLLKEEESFWFDESFELCYRDEKSVLSLVRIGGGILSEMGLFAFRLCLSELLEKSRFPMIFDDLLTLPDQQSAEALMKILQERCGQFFMATSSRDLYEICDDSVCTLTLS